MTEKLVVGSCVLVTLGLFQSCAPDFAPTDETFIRNVMAEQETAWDAGDIPAFMNGYSNDVCFMGRKTRTCGAREVEKNYLANYPDKAAMGDMRFDIHELVPAGADHAWMTGAWELVRATDTIGGGFSLLWHREAAGWRIIRDHTY